MGSDGLQWDAEDGFTSARGNQKTRFVGTGAQIAALGTTYAGMKVFCTSTGSGFTADNGYVRNSANSAWIHVEGNVAFTDADIEMQGGPTIKNALVKRFVYHANNAGYDPWTKTNLAGGGVTDSGVIDGIDGGRRLTTGATISDAGSLSLNNIRHFNPANCTIYGVTKRNEADSGLYCGIADNTNYATDEAVIMVNHSANANLTLDADDGGVGTSVSTDVATGTGIVRFKIICGASNQKLYLLVASVWTLKATQSTRLPTDAAQPYFHALTNAAAAKTCDLIDYEAFNDS